MFCSVGSTGTGPSPNCNCRRRFASCGLPSARWMASSVMPGTPCSCWCSCCRTAHPGASSPGGLVLCVTLGRSSTGRSVLCAVSEAAGVGSSCASAAMSSAANVLRATRAADHCTAPNMLWSEDGVSPTSIGVKCGISESVLSLESAVCVRSAGRPPICSPPVGWSSTTSVVTG